VEPESVNFRIKVISAMELPKKSNSDKEIVDPYVKIKIRTSSRKEILQNQDFKTKVVDDNGNCPIWNETTTFQVETEEVNFIIFKVFDVDVGGKKNLLAWNAIPLHVLRCGVRNVRLRNKNLEYIEGARLLCEFNYPGMVPV
jgi:Ca2+-dependent lipid-binding protein